MKPPQHPPELSINKDARLWKDFFQLTDVEDLVLDDETGICNLTMPTSTGDDRYAFCQQNVSNMADTTLFYDNKFVILARTLNIQSKELLLYYVEFNPNSSVSINEASNEGTAMENYILDKYKLCAFSLYNAANLDIPLTTQRMHLEQMRTQSNNDLLVFQSVNINNSERALFDPKESEFDQAVTPIVMLLETTFKGKYKVTTHMDKAIDIITNKIRGFVNK